MTSLTRKRILITGAGSGIGRATARRFAELGAEVILLGRRTEPLRETLPQAPIFSLDHADPAAVSTFAQTCPTLDGMLLCAGQLATGSVQDSGVEIFDQMIAANLRGPWLLCHHLGARLTPGSSVVFMGSNIGIRPIPNSAAYCVAKAGLHMLAQVLAQEWAPRGIRCNAIAPGPVDTPMLHQRLQEAPDPEEARACLTHVNPLGRLGHPEELADLAAHLLSDASTWLTGALIPMDGGAAAVL